MNWELAIESKRVPLLGVVLALFAEIGLTEGGTVERIARPLHRFILSRLRSAESAVRRLIVAAARDIVLEHKPRRPASGKPKTSSADKTKAEGEGGKPAQARLPVQPVRSPQAPGPPVQEEEAPWTRAARPRPR
ncbi:MAG: hypothetical protein U1E67_06085 [Hyphomicrobiales bacterium]